MTRSRRGGNSCPSGRGCPVCGPPFGAIHRKLRQTPLEEPAHDDGYGDYAGDLWDDRDWCAFADHLTAMCDCDEHDVKGLTLLP